MMGIAPLFRLSNDQVSTIIQNTVSIIAQWKQFAAKYKIPKNEQDRMSTAFRKC